MSLEEILQRNKEVAMKALKGKTDEEIAREMDIESPFLVTTIRRSLGIRSKRAVDITEKSKMVSGTGTPLLYKYVHFRLPRELIEEANLDVESPMEFSGKVVGKTLVLSFKNV